MSCLCQSEILLLPSRDCLQLFTGLPTPCKTPALPHSPTSPAKHQSSCVPYSPLCESLPQIFPFSKEVDITTGPTFLKVGFSSSLALCLMKSEKLSLEGPSIKNMGFLSVNLTCFHSCFLSKQRKPMLWLKTLLDIMFFHVLFSPTANKKKSFFWCRPKTTMIIFDFTSPPQGL